MNERREQACCFTGHRKIVEKRFQTLNDRLNVEVGWMITHGVTDFWAGGALGFDTMAAIAVLQARNSGSPVRLHLALPCPEQTRGWNKKDIEIYEYIRGEADDQIVLSPHYHNGVMHIRNRFMVDHSGFCICYFDREIAGEKTTGGTLYTVSYAKKNGLTVINLMDVPPDDGQIEFDFTV